MLYNLVASGHLQLAWCKSNRIENASTTMTFHSLPLPEQSPPHIEHPLIRMSTSQGLCSSPRGGPPFPTSHEHQRAARASGQSTTYSQGVYNGQPRDTTSTTAFNQMRSPPIAAWAIPSQIYHATSHLHHAISPDDSMDSESPPAPIDGVSLIRQTTPLQDRPRSQSLLLQHRANPMNSGLDSTRPRFRSLGPHLTPDLVAEIERVHPRGPGMSGVAYAGSPLSGPVSGSTQLMFSPESLPKQSTLEIIRGGKRSCPGELEERPTGVPRCNTTPPDQDRETWEHHRRGSGERDPPQIIPAQQPSPKLELQRANSPKYIPSLSDHSDHSASHNPGDRELRSTQAAPLPPNPPVSRQNVPRTEQPRSTQSAVAKLATQSPNGQSVKARFPDKSLPVQEDSDKDDEDEQDDNPERRERDRSIPGGGEDGWLAHNGHDQVVSDPGREHFDASSPTSSSDLVATYYYNNDPHHSHSRSGAPISHTPRSHTTTTSPSPSSLIAGTSRSNVTRPFLPPCSPSPRVDLRHKSYAVWDNGTVRLSKMDPNVVRERRVLQLQADTLDNGISDSMVSQSSTPFPGTQCNPPTSLQNKPSRGRCGEIEDSQASTHSSPSHQSAPLAPLSRRHRGRRRCERSQDLRRLPQRVESAPPRVSCPEMSSSEETARKSKAGEHQSKPQSVHQPARKGESADDGDEAHVDDGEWIDVDVGAESIADNLLQLESHSGYVSDPKKRRRRWEHHWEVLLNALHALDRETNTPLMLLAAPSHTGKLHSVTSRAVRRDSSLKSTDMKNIRSSFAGIAFRQQAAHPPSPVEQPSCPRLSSCDEAPSNSNSGREEDLRRALKTAIGGVHALWGLYERQATHLIEAKHKLDEDKEQVQLLLTQMFGVSVC